MPKLARPEFAPPQRWWLRGFQAYTTGYLRRHFHALRLHGAWPVLPPERPVVVYLNHPAWWDPLICLQLARTVCRQRANYAPIDACMLARYRFLRRLGFFGVEPGTARGARQFLAASESILKQSATSLWLTPQGHFADVRERPVTLAAGLAHLARRCPEAVYLPLALEYTFWTERRPEALAYFGTPATGPENLAAALAATQDELAVAVQTRDAAQFTTVLGGTAGEGGIYELWRRLRSGWRGERFQQAHGRPEPLA